LHACVAKLETETPHTVVYKSEYNINIFPKLTLQYNTQLGDVTVD